MTITMNNRDSHDAITAILAIFADFTAIWLAQMFAVWIRFDSGWIDLPFGRLLGIYPKYAKAALCSLPIYFSVFQILKLYSRPQSGTFSAKIPRLIRGTLLSCCGVLVLTALLKNVIPFSNAATLVSFGTVSLAVLIERKLMFNLEIAMAKRVLPCHTAILIGTNDDAVRFLRAVKGEPRLRTMIAGIVSVKGDPIEPGIPHDLILGEISNLEKIVETANVDKLILATHSLSHDETVKLVVFCERHLVHFSMIPDLFRMMTSRAEFQMIDNVPLVGVGRWPLDKVWNRMKKRIIDIFGALVGLALSAPVIAVAAILIKLESEGAIFYEQERCGRRGQTFKIYKLRTMRKDAEQGEKPGWTVGDDPRRTKIGSVLRKLNIDELPQFWNVLKGEMSLVGPRPERPYFVERFTPGIEHYMWRHVSKPGLTGWAQVNGLRGDTSISERVKYDLYYLENWSIAFDLKIIFRTIFTYKNAC